MYHIYKFKVDDQAITEPYVGANLAGNIRNNHNKYKSYLRKRNVHSIFVNPATEDEVS